jgi:hypothetical protein
MVSRSPVISQTNTYASRISTNHQAICARARLKVCRIGPIDGPSRSMSVYFPASKTPRITPAMMITSSQVNQST